MSDLGKILHNELRDLNALLIFDDFQRIESKILQLFTLILEVLETLDDRVKIISVGRQILPFYDRTAVALKKSVQEIHSRLLALEQKQEE